MPNLIIFYFIYVFTRFGYIQTAANTCTFNNIGVVLDSTKLVKKIEFTESRIEECISLLLNQLKLKGIRPWMSGRLYHRNKDCEETQRTLAETEHFVPTHGPGNIRDALKNLKHHNSSDNFNMSCAEKHLLSQYRDFSDNLTVGLIIAVYDSVKDKYPIKDRGQYWVFVYHQHKYVNKVLIEGVKNRDKAVVQILNLMIKFVCPTQPPPTTSYVTSSISTSYTKPTKTTHHIHKTSTSILPKSSIVTRSSATSSSKQVVSKSSSTVVQPIKSTSTPFVTCSSFHPSTSTIAPTTPGHTVTAKPTTKSEEQQLLADIDDFMKTSIQSIARDENKVKTFMKKGIELLTRIDEKHIETENPMKLADFIKKSLLEIGTLHNQVTTFQMQDAGAKILSEKVKEFNGVTFKDGESCVTFSKSFFQSKQDAATKRAVVAIMKYPTLPVMTSLKSTDEGEDIASDSFLAAAQMPPAVNVTFPSQLSYTLYIRQGLNPRSKYRCVFWKKSSPSNGSWSHEGCQFHSIADQYVTCKCHYQDTVSFSVMRLKAPSTIPRTTLRLTTIIGCAVAGGVCIIILFIFILFRRSLRHNQNVIHLNLALSIAISNGLYVMANYSFKNKYWCMGVSIGIMYFYLATLFWIFVETFHLYMLIVRKSKDMNMIMFYMIIGWVAPSIIVALTAALEKDYFVEENCWLSYDTWVIWTLVGPSLFLILLSVVFLAVSLNASFKLERSLAGVFKFQRVAKLLFMLIPFIGLSWSISLLAVNERKLIYQYVLTGVNGVIAILALSSVCFLCSGKPRRSNSTTKKSMHSMRSNSSMGKDNKIDSSTLSLSVITEPAFHAKTNF